MVFQGLYRIMTNLSKYTEELFKEMYWKEIERKDKINSQLSLPAGILLALAGVGAYYIRNSPSSHSGLWNISFIVLSAFLCISIVIAVYYFFRAYHLGYAYRYIPTPNEIYRYALDLKSYYESIQESNIDKMVENDVRGFLTAKYSEHCTENTLNNDDKSKYLYRTNVAILISLIILFFSLIPFYKVCHSGVKIQKSEIVEKE